MPDCPWAGRALGRTPCPCECALDKATGCLIWRHIGIGALDVLLCVPQTEQSQPIVVMVLIGGPMHAEVYIRPAQAMSQLGMLWSGTAPGTGLCTAALPEVISVLSHIQRGTRVLESDMSAGTEGLKTKLEWEALLQHGAPTSTSKHLQLKEAGCWHHVDGTNAEVKSLWLNARGRWSRHAETRRSPSFSQVLTVASSGTRAANEESSSHMPPASSVPAVEGLAMDDGLGG